MEWTGTLREFCTGIKKYRFFGLVLLIGLLFLILPEEREEKHPEESIAVDSRVTEGLQEQLSKILCKLDGAGNVQVLLTEAAGPQTIYEIRQQKREDTGSRELQSEAMILEGADRGEYGLVSRVDPPRYLGAVVLCQGADSPSVRLAIVDAVSAATGLGADKISVWKMK